MDIATRPAALRAWINDLQSDEARNEFARRCETSIGHLRNIAYGKKCAPELAALIELATSGAVRRWHLRPRDWHRIWPELVFAVGHPPVPLEVAVVSAIPPVVRDRPAARAGV